MTQCVKIKETKGYDFSFSSTPRQASSPLYMPANKNELTIGNRVYLLVGAKLVKVKVVANLPDLGIKVEPINENDDIGQSKTFTPSYFFVKVD